MKRIPPQLKVRVFDPLIWLTLIAVPFLLTYPVQRLNPFCECRNCIKYDTSSFNIKLVDVPQLWIVSNSFHSYDGVNESEMLMKSYPSKWSVWNEVVFCFTCTRSLTQDADNKAIATKKNILFIIFKLNVNAKV